MAKATSLTSRARSLGARALGALALAGIGVSSTGCPSPDPPVQLQGQVRLTLLHTSDIHSRLFPYDLQIGSIDAKLGLGPQDGVVRVGGAARLAHVISRERSRADRVLHLDGGDCFQGAPVFNFFNGEAELRALAEMGTDAMIVANHEFDKGSLNLGEQLSKWATFPVLAANYRFDDAQFPGSTWLSRALKPYSTFNVDGLRVAVIGLGNLSSLSSLFEVPNSLGIQPLNTRDIAQFYVDLVRPTVDLVVFVTHIGLEHDESMIANTTGIDVVLGGHNHIVLQPPKLLEDCQRVDERGYHYIEVLSGDAQAEGEAPKYTRRRCEPRKVLLAHSGAFAKFVGRLDLVVSNDARELQPGYDPVNGYELLSSDFKLIPITEDLPEDPRVRELLIPYKAGLDALINLDLLAGYAPDGVTRVAPSGGDSPLGNMVANAMWLRQGVQTDFSLTNTTGIRAAMVPGPVTIEQLYNIFPFDNSISKMNVSGVEVQQLFDFVARRSASRGCASQVQIAGARVVINCSPCEDREDLKLPCSTDADCPGSICEPTAKRCLPTACAQRIYIGRNEKQRCKTHEDCGAGQIGACDTYKPDAEGFGRCWTPIDPIASYELATSNYLAGGGSGFSVLKRNTTQFDTRVEQRDALTDYIRQGRPCGYDPANGTSDGLKACSTNDDCGDTERFACACVGHVVAQGAACVSQGSCAGAGRCVYRGCRDSVADFHRRVCESGSEVARGRCEAELNPCELAGEECKFLSCIDERIGNFSDGRLMMVGN